MAVNRSKRMEPVQRVVEERAQKAAVVFAEAQRKLEEQKQRLEQLEDFRNDYRNQRVSIGEAGMDAFRLRDYNAFVARIDVAIEKQRKVVQEAEQELQRQREIWAEHWSRSRAIDKVVDRYQADERRDEERKTQRQSDEQAQRRRVKPV